VGTAALVAGAKAAISVAAAVPRPRSGGALLEIG
jgi:hypothetical protein